MKHIERKDRRILFTDLDGTLLDNNKKVSEKLMLTLKKLQEMGHILVLSSGRPYKSIADTKEYLGLSNHNLYICANNGGQIVNCETQAPVLEKRIPMEDVAYISRLATEHNTYCHTYSDTHIITLKDGEELAYYTRHIHMPYEVVSDFTRALQKEPFKMIAIHPADHDFLERFKEALYPWAENRIATLFSNPYYLELFPASSGKGTALKELCEKLEIPLANAMAAGDMDNDISMLEAAGTGVAMANATASVKEAADIVTAFDNNHDGLLQPLTDFFLQL